MALTAEQRAIIDAAKTNPYVRAALDMIATTEGTISQANGGYSTNFGGAQFDGYTTHPKKDAPYVDLKGRQRTANDAGRYQIAGSTFDSLAKRLGKSDFSPETQDEMAIYLMMEKGALEPIMRGDIDGGISRLGSVWYSLPTSTKQDFVRARTWDYAKNAYTQALQKHANGVDVVYPTATPSSGMPIHDRRPPTANRHPMPFDTSFTRGADGRLQLPHTRSDVDVRQLLNNRYASRGAVFSNQPLTHDNAHQMMNVIYSPQGTPQVPFPYVPANSPNGMAIVNGQVPLPAGSVPQSSGPVPTPMPEIVPGQPPLTQETVYRPGETPPQPPKTLEYVPGRDGSTFENVPFNIPSNTQDSSELLALAMYDLAMDTRGMPTTQPMMTPEEMQEAYMVAELSKAQNQQDSTSIPFGRYPSTYDSQLLALINTTPAAIG